MLGPWGHSSTNASPPFTSLQGHPEIHDTSKCFILKRGDHEGRVRRWPNISPVQDPTWSILSLLPEWDSWQFRPRVLSCRQEAPGRPAACKADTVNQVTEKSESFTELLKNRTSHNNSEVILVFIKCTEASWIKSRKETGSNPSCKEQFIQQIFIEHLLCQAPL